MSTTLDIKPSRTVGYSDGQEVELSTLTVGNNVLLPEGRLLCIARSNDEWFDEIDDVQGVIASLKSWDSPPDLLTFWQRLPDTEPKYSFFRELENVAAVHVESFDAWWQSLRTDIRKKSKRATKRGVDIRQSSVDEGFVRGVMGIFNESPVRRGKPFRHYRKSFESVEKMLLHRIDHCELIGAFEGERLIGFVKLEFAEGRFANPALIVTAVGDRGRYYTDDALIARCVELCAQRGVPYLTYTLWRQGEHAVFLRRHGFAPTPMPRYYVPLTLKGALALRLRLHHGMRGLVPESAMATLRSFRSAYYGRKALRGEQRVTDTT